MVCSACTIRASRAWRVSGFEFRKPIRVDGFTVGVLSTHFKDPFELPQADLRAIEFHAEMAASSIGGHR